MKTKIVAFTNLFPRPWEPQRATFNRQQLEWLSQKVDLKVLVPVSWLDWLITSLNFENTKRSVSSISTTYFRYFYIPKLFRFSYGTSLSLSCLAILSELKGNNRPQIIYTPWVYPDGFAMTVYGKMLKIPVVILVQGSDINFFPSITGVRPQIIWALKQAAAVIAVSQDLANKCINLGAKAENTHVLYNGVDQAHFKPLDQMECRIKLMLDKQAKIILYVGNLLSSKGCIDLFDSFTQLKTQHPEVLLVYVGKGDACKAEITVRANSLGISESVQFAGSQPLESIATWMGAADVVALVSHSEGVPNVLMEAMACGKPIVATHVGGIPEVVPEFAGILVPPKDINAITAALARVLTTKTWDANKIVRHVAPFTWEGNIAELEAILTQKANQP